MLMSFFKYRDMWKTVKNDVPGYTWYDGQNVPKSRIGFILVSELFQYSCDNIYLRMVLLFQI